MLFSQRAGWSQQFVSVISWGVRRLLVWCEGLPHIRESGQWPAVCKQRVISTPPGWRHIHYNRLPPLCLPLQPSQLIRSSPLYDHFHMTIRDHPHPPLLSRTITDHWSILPPSFAPFHCPPPQASDFDWTNESWTKCSSGEIISEAVVLWWLLWTEFHKLHWEEISIVRGSLLLLVVILFTVCLFVCAR